MEGVCVGEIPRYTARRVAMQIFVCLAGIFVVPSGTPPVENIVNNYTRLEDVDMTRVACGRNDG